MSRLARKQEKGGRASLGWWDLEPQGTLPWGESRVPSGSLCDSRTQNPRCYQDQVTLKALGEGSFHLSQLPGLLPVLWSLTMQPFPCKEKHIQRSQRR